MKRIYIPNDLFEWLAILVGLTFAGLLGAGMKSWLDNVLEDSGLVGWLPGVGGLGIFAVVAVPLFFWVIKSAKYREGPSDDDVEESDEG